MGTPEKTAEEQTSKLVEELRQLSITEGMSENKVEAITGIAQPNVNSFYKMNNSPTLTKFLRISNAVGYTLKLERIKK